MGYANHFRRLIASVIDIFILWIIITVIPWVILKLGLLDRTGLRSVTIIAMLVPMVYFPVFELSKWQASIGKCIMKLKVTNLAGNKISIGTAIGRQLGRLVDLVTYGVGIAMILWTKKHQALHDKIASTVVVSSDTDASFFEKQGEITIQSNVNSKIVELEKLRSSGILNEKEFELAVKNLKTL
jgi:uncharacterized RDD family membrane protein YckC